MQIPTTLLFRWVYGRRRFLESISCVLGWVLHPSLLLLGLYSRIVTVEWDTFCFFEGDCEVDGVTHDTQYTGH